MIADSAARLRALDVSQSFIVQAPAGSGKTELLIQRYLKLLETVRLAGCGGRDYVHAQGSGRDAIARDGSFASGRAEGIEPEAEHERLRSRSRAMFSSTSGSLRWNLLRNPARLRIETIDALCAAITRRMPWLARFGAMPEISEKAEDLYREAARNTLTHLENGHAGLAHLLLHLDNDFQRARQLISQMLERRDQWLRHTGANLDALARIGELAAAS